ncbi:MULTISPECIES: ribose 5-phosphate isomerase A [Staphylococcus]|nr:MULTISPECIES: ribose 5-phosphate isomerase A [Staphylococcus]AVO01437.1 ribose 5-phosphate isomerase A [Staphylococcus simulans]AVO04389.1 ribose 5-phosphate isomerase A [Staphylococcus simulans]AWG17985.1 ribose 5-phosphate isomerase A [Staphylococcus simulans]AWI00954.1 ribose 5-phosphate isomerase A [Staphylococcus simulans]MDK7927598.1 ribose 5-phosphate isomerase A [Staphylococcus simulans]
MMDVRALKLQTVKDAVSEIKDGMVVGIGTGSTIELLLPHIAKLLDDGATITGVCTSNKTALLAKELGITIVNVNDVDHIDVAIDGADEFDPQLNLIKGGGGALFREKVIDEMAERFVVIADETKQVDYLGQTFKLPVEVDRFNWMLVAKKIEKDTKAKVSRRNVEDITFITDNDNYILDVELPPNTDPYDMHEYLIHLTGVLETGYFLDLADRVIVGKQEGVEIIDKV